MDFEALLKGRQCECGKIHSCRIRHIIIKSGAVSELGKLTVNYHHILLVADTNTYRVCGENVRMLLGDRLEKALIYKSRGYLVPNEDAIKQLMDSVSEKTDLIIGIGSGVIQDLCKYVSFLSKVPYFIIATAPSMDGYASDGAAMIINNMKVSFSSRVADTIICDIDILKNAPMDMIKSGYGDIIGKFSSLNDWKLSHLVNGEYFCDYVYNLTYQMVLKVKDLGPKLLTRDEDAINVLMEALIIVGIAMAYAGNSRPASGSEHHMSHFFEVIGIMKNEPYLMHGVDVAFSTVYTERLREKLLALPEPPSPAKFDEAAWEQKIRDIYAQAADKIIALQKKLRWYEQNRYIIYKNRWQEIKAILQEVPSSSELLRYLDSVELDIQEFENTYGEDKIQNAIWFAKDLKDRYTILWLYFTLLYINI